MRQCRRCRCQAGLVSREGSAADAEVSLEVAERGLGASAIGPVQHALAVAAGGDDTAAPQQRELARRVGLADAGAFGDLVDRQLGSAGEQEHDLLPGRAGQGAEEFVGRGREFTQFVEAGRDVRQRRAGEIAPRALALAAPVAGAACYLWWVGHVFGDWKIPIDRQNDLRGGVSNPIIRIGEAASDLLHRDVDGLHFPFAIALIVLAVIVWRRLPLSYALFSIAIVATSLAAGNLNSIERYGLNAFPLVIALAMVTPSRGFERVTSAVCAVGLTWMCALAWLGLYVP